MLKTKSDRNAVKTATRDSQEPVRGPLSRREWGGGALAAAAIGLAGTHCASPQEPTVTSAPATTKSDEPTDTEPESEHGGTSEADEPTAGHRIQAVVEVKTGANPAGLCVEHPRTAEVCKSMHQAVLLTYSSTSDFDEVEVTQDPTGPTPHRFDDLFQVWPDMPNGADGTGIFRLNKTNHKNRIFVLKPDIGVTKRPNGCTFENKQPPFAKTLSFKFRLPQNSPNGPFSSEHCHPLAHTDYHFEC